MATHDLGEITCPSCNASLPAVTNVTDADDTESKDVTPSPGDLSVCLYCAEILAFTSDMKLRVISAKEFLELPKEAARVVGMASTMIQMRIEKSKEFAPA